METTSTSETKAAPGAPEDNSVPLTNLREDLDFYPGTPSLEGYPTYVIHDRIQHVFYNLGLTEFEILKRWHLNDADEIANDILQTTTLYVTPEDVNFLSDYLSRNGLAKIETADQRERLSKILDKKKPLTPASLFKYFMINIRLARPDRFLTNTYWMVKFVFTKTFWWIMLALCCAGIYLVIRDYSSFLEYTRNIFTLQGAAFILISLAIAKSFHELGHAYTCKHLGLAVPKFGLRLMVILPFFYTDTNESWKLKSRKQRFLIGAGGIMSECALAIVAMLLWGILDDGPARNICFYLFVVSWVSSLAINMTPFLKWDGYYMFSDLIGVQNLQKRGFNLGKWQLREWLFKLKDEKPINLSNHLHKIVLIYAYGAWIKRAIIFLAIGYLIYTRVFKVLGIFLLTMQAYSFVFSPIIKEVIEWWKKRELMTWNKHSITTLTVFVGLLSLLFIPWQTTIRTPAVVAPRIQAILYSPDEAQVSEVNVAVGASVKQGDILVRLQNTNLEYDIRLAKSEVDILQISLNRFGSQDALGSRNVVQQQLQSAVERTTGLIDTFRKLTIEAPFDGKIMDLYRGLEPGTWVGNQAPIAVVADQSSLELYAFIPEKDLTRVSKNGQVTFYPENPKLLPTKAAILDIDQAETQSLSYLMLATRWGGSIPTEKDVEVGLKPTKAFYRVRLALDPEQRQQFELSVRGTLHLDGEKHSIATDLYRKAISILIRESGFLIADRTLFTETLQPCLNP